HPDDSPASSSPFRLTRRVVPHWSPIRPRLMSGALLGQRRVGFRQVPVGDRPTPEALADDRLDLSVRSPPRARPGEDQVALTGRDARTSSDAPTGRDAITGRDAL